MASPKGARERKATAPMMNTEKPNPYCPSCEQQAEWKFDDEFEIWFHECLQPISRKEKHALEKMADPSTPEPAHDMDSDEERIFEEFFFPEELPTVVEELEGFLQRRGLLKDTTRLRFYWKASGFDTQAELEALQLLGDRDIWYEFEHLYLMGLYRSDREEREWQGAPRAPRA